jgi:hypothetical protein
VNRAIQIYGLVHPTTDVVWYVGASGHPSLRVKAHRAKSAAKGVRTWVASLSSPPTKVILETVTLKNWRKRERYWVATSRDKNPNLLNGNVGGGGGTNRIEVNDSILTLRVPKSLIEAIDQAAKKAERERSDWIRRTLKKATEGTK